MNKGINIMKYAVCSLAIAAVTASGAVDEQRIAALEKQVQELTEKQSTNRVAQLEEQVQILTEEVQNDRFRDVMPEVGESVYGMGPAASKVYNKDHGLSIGGYGEVLYENYNGSDLDETDQFDMLRAIIYIGYKFNDKWVLNTEFEFEHADESFTEFAYLDYLHSDALNFRGGLVLLPVGIVNELHEPTVFLGAKRTTVENRIIPSTWRENGGGIFGDIGPVSYKAYVVTSFDGEDFSDEGIRSGRQKGIKAKADDFSGVLRTDWEVMPAVTLGGSVYAGDQGQEADVDASMVLAEAHMMVRKGGVIFNALVVGSTLDDAELINTPGNEPGEQMFGWYTELGYDVLSTLDVNELQFTPFVRLEQVDTQYKAAPGTTADPANDLDIITVGLNFKPIEEVVFKLEHQFIRDGNDANRDQTNFAMGYVF